MTLKKNEYETLECQRKNNVNSETILTESVIGRHQTWEYSRLSRTRPKNTGIYNQGGKLHGLLETMV